MQIRPIRRLLADDGGATALEYGFFVAFVAAALLVGAEHLAAGVTDMFQTVNGAVSDKIVPN